MAARTPTPAAGACLTIDRPPGPIPDFENGVQMSSTDAADATSGRLRQRSSRRTRQASSETKGGRPSGPPRQRRPALAALALLLIVGGALLAGVLAVRMDSRVSVLVARDDIPPGTQITETDLATAQVATDSVPTIAEELASQVIGTYATTTIPANSLVEERMLSTQEPVSGDRAIVSVGLNPKLTPASELSAGDLVQVVRVAGQSAKGKVTELTTALVLSVNKSEGTDLGGQSTRSATLLVPAEAAGEVIDASAADLAGLALLERGQDTGVTLEVGR